MKILFLVLFVVLCFGSLCLSQTFDRTSLPHYLCLASTFLAFCGAGWFLYKLDGGEHE